MPITILREVRMRMCSMCAPMALKPITGKDEFSLRAVTYRRWDCPQALLDKVLSAVNPEDVRPITDYVADYVRSAVIVSYQVVADIYVPYGVDTATVLEKPPQH
nr:Baseplate J-like protein [Klebsiella pneumoniae]